MDETNLLESVSNTCTSSQLLCKQHTLLHSVRRRIDDFGYAWKTLPRILHTYIQRLVLRISCNPYVVDKINLIAELYAIIHESDMN